MDLPVLIKVALGLVALSLVLFLSGYSSNYWFTSSSQSGFHYGLWVICSASDCVSYNSVLSSTPAHAYVARFCTCYELIASIVSLVLLCLFVCKSARPGWATSGYSTLLSAGIMGFLGAVIFIGREKSLDTSGSVNVSWSGILVIFAAIMQIIAAVLIILPIRKGQVNFEQV